MSWWRAGQWRSYGTAVLTGVITLAVAACSGDGANNGKKDDQQQHSQAADTAPRGQWVPVPPNMVWVPQGSDAVQSSPRYYAPVPPTSDPGYQPQPGYDRRDYGQRGMAQPAPQGNPWAVPRYDDDRRSGNRWDVPPQPSRWQAPAGQPRFRPLEDDDRPAYTREAPRPSRNTSPWQTHAPYDRPYGSSANPNAGAMPYGGYPGYGYGYGGYPTGPGAWPGYGGGYGYGGPTAGGLPGLWPGVW